MKLYITLLALLVLVGAGFWWQQARSRPVAPGWVESQLRTFGPQLAPQLEASSTFAKVEQPLAGYRPETALPQPPSGLKPEEQQAWLAMAKREAQAGPESFTPFFPERYSAGSEVRGQGMAITLLPLGSNAAQAQIENGKLVYHDVYRATDSLQVVRSGLSEEFLFLRDASAPTRFDYEISSASGVKTVLLKDNAIHFVSVSGQELQIEAPTLMESRMETEKADGHRPPLQGSRVHWEITPPPAGQSWPKLSLVVNDAKSLHYPVVIDPSWMATLGSLNAARYEHTATLLTNGQVLVVGGMDSSGGDSAVLLSAELFDPTSGTWTVTGDLHTPRDFHTATLLPNGMVLVAGGETDSSPTYLASSELYDPSTGVWTTTGSLATGRCNHTATLLLNGKVLVAGGYTSPPNPSVASAEIYDPATGAWTATGSLTFARFNHAATLLPSGKVLVTGGEGSSDTYTSAELYDPAAGTWTTTGNLAKARYTHTATLLPNGKVLAAGGYTPFPPPGSGNAVTSAELYDTTTGTWSATGSLTVGRSSHTATLLANGDVLVTGGYNFGPYSGPLTGELYDPATGVWTQSGSVPDITVYFHTATLLPGGQVLVTGGLNGSGASAQSKLFDLRAASFASTGSMAQVRSNFTTTLLPTGKVLVAGGFDGTNVLITCELYDPATATFSTTGNMVEARYNHTATLLPNGLVLAAGGVDIYGYDFGNADLYNPGTGTWTATGDMAFGTASHTATLLANGQVLVAGGSGGDGTGAQLYDPGTAQWTATGAMHTGRGFHTATLLTNGQVLVAGGFGGSGDEAYDTVTAELYDPTTGVWTVTGQLTTGRTNHTATLLPDGRVMVTGGNYYGTILVDTELYDPTSGNWITSGHLNTARELQSAVLQPSGEVLVAGGYDGTNYLASAEVYQPATGTWVPAGNLGAARGSFSATELPSGKVLLAGGKNATNALLTAELFDPGLGLVAARQPVISSVTSAITSAMKLTLTGARFTGVSEASGGASNNSASNIPVLELQSLSNEDELIVPVNPATSFTATSFKTLAPGSFSPGYALATLFVNGTPSASKIVLFGLFPQSIGFPSQPSQVAGNQTFTLNATSSSFLPIGYTVQSGPGSISGSVLTVGGLGTVVVAANQAGSVNFQAAPTVTQSFTVSGLAQTITFPAITSAHKVGTSVTLKATASSGLAVSYAVTAGSASIVGSTLTVGGAGTITVTANQPGDTTYQAAAPASISFTGTAGAQTITFPPIADRAFNKAPFNLNASASSGLPIVYTATGPCRISGATVMLTGAGTVKIRASQPGNVNYLSATSVLNTFKVTVVPQTITFPALADRVFTSKSFTLKAKASSGLPVTYSSTGPVSITGDTATLLGAGKVRIRASQPGDTTYTAAPSVLITFTVAPGKQTITFPAVPDQVLGTAPFQLHATASSGLPITYTAFGKATVSGNVVTLTGVGAVRITADQPGNANFPAAATVQVKFKVTAAP